MYHFECYGLIIIYYLYLHMLPKGLNCCLKFFLYLHHLNLSGNLVQLLQQQVSTKIELMYELRPPAKHSKIFLQIIITYGDDVYIRPKINFPYSFNLLFKSSIIVQDFPFTDVQNKYSTFYMYLYIANHLLNSPMHLF